MMVKNKKNKKNKKLNMLRTDHFIFKLSIIGLFVSFFIKYF